MTDLYWFGQVNRVSPEAPVTIVAVDKTERREGAAANVANNIEAMGVACERIFGSSPQRIQKIRLLARDQHVVRIDFDYPQVPIECDAAYEEALERCAIVVFVDYGKGSLANVKSLIAKAREANRRVFVDPCGHDFECYRGATMLKPNKQEMKELVGGWASADELDFKARQFLLVSGIESILLTQAGEGMTLYTKNDTVHLEAESTALVDVSGAGEAALAGYTAAIAKGFAPLESVRFANKAAGISIARFGTTVVTHAELFG
jgi:D-glycero-beta-D-manno-heptose-7-phosphate kinase